MFELNVPDQAGTFGYPSYSGSRYSLRHMNNRHSLKQHSDRSFKITNTTSRPYVLQVLTVLALVLLLLYSGSILFFLFFLPVYYVKMTNDNTTTSIFTVIVSRF